MSTTTTADRMTFCNTEMLLSTTFAECLVYNHSTASASPMCDNGIALAVNVIRCIKLFLKNKTNTIIDATREFCMFLNGCLSDKNKMKLYEKTMLCRAEEHTIYTNYFRFIPYLLYMLLVQYSNHVYLYNHGEYIMSGLDDDNHVWIRYILTPYLVLFFARNCNCLQNKLFQNDFLKPALNLINTRLLIFFNLIHFTINQELKCLLYDESGLLHAINSSFWPPLYEYETLTVTQAAALSAETTPLIMTNAYTTSYAAHDERTIHDICKICLDMDISEVNHITTMFITGQYRQKYRTLCTSFCTSIFYKMLNDDQLGKKKEVFTCFTEHVSALAVDVGCTTPGMIFDRKLSFSEAIPSLTNTIRTILPKTIIANPYAYCTVVIIFTLVFYLYLLGHQDGAAITDYLESLYLVIVNQNLSIHHYVVNKDKQIQQIDGVINYSWNQIFNNDNTLQKWLTMFILMLSNKNEFYKVLEHMAARVNWQLTFDTYETKSMIRKIFSTLYNFTENIDLAG